ncbi:hypothetical protein S40288_01860 [Stachybotrys chartarum IBT 40288]|nr:hypothetical protein S40288_01860 [Stachybotrys chartarum IBT 40288]
MARQVFAHYMVGLTSTQTPAQWSKEINDAQTVGIDGFALNIGPNDSWTLTQLHSAYSAAEAAGFGLFISFDMAVGDWAPQTVVDLVNAFAASSAQVRVDGLPLVSTFEGPAWADNWQGVRDATGGIYLVPDWSSLGPHGVQARLDVIDGHFAWQAWPWPGETQKTTEEDLLYMGVLGDKSYMMGVSPWFYTNLPQYNKNWYFNGDSLWFDRWQQAIDLLPDFVQIITWNDFGESSYISDVEPSQIVAGANPYIDGFSHAAFRSVLPYFIAAYKAGSRDVAPPTPPQAIAYYRTTPLRAGPDGGTICGQSGSMSAAECSGDVVSVITVTVDSTDIVVQVGARNETFRTAEGASFFSVPFGADTGGEVALYMDGRSVVGPAITNAVPATGYVNFNALAIGL